MSMLWRAPDDVYLWLLAFAGGAAELHDGGEVDGLDELVEAHGGRMVGAGVGGADGGVEAVGRHVVGALGLVGFFSGGWRRELRLGLVAGGGFGCGDGRGLWRRGYGFGGFALLALFALGRGVGVGAGFAVEGELAAVGDDEGLVLFWHLCALFSDADGCCYAATAG